VRRTGRLVVSATILVLLALSLRPLGLPRDTESQARLLGDDMVRIQKRFSDFLTDLKRDVLIRGSRFAAGEPVEINRADEAFVRSVDGRIVEYAGEISHWAEHRGQPGSWMIREHRGELFWTLRLDQSVFYVRHLWSINEPRDPIFHFSFPRALVTLSLVAEGEFLSPQILEDGLTRVLDFPLTAEQKPVLTVKASIDVSERLNRLRGHGALVLVLLLVFSLMLLVMRFSGRFEYRFFWQPLLEEWVLLFVLMRLISFWLGVPARITWPWGGQGRMDLLLLLGCLLAVIRGLIFLVKRGVPLAPGWALAGTVLFALGLKGFRSLTTAVSFPSDRFTFDPAFLVLLITGAAMLAVPLFMLQMEALRRGKTGRVVLLLLLPPLALWLCDTEAGILWLFVPLTLIFNLAVSRKSPWIWLNIPLAALMLQMIILGEGERERKEYIEDNLSAIFLNQGNYAKSLAREMVHEINLSISDLRVLFYPDEEQVNLSLLWEQSLAAKENIPSGIFVCDSRDQVIKQVAHQIPFLDLDLPADTLFPFWSISQTRVSLYGRPTSVAYASIRVFDGGQVLGTVYIQVLDISSLLHRDMSAKHIFALNPRIAGQDIGFFRIDSRGRLVENPFHVNFQHREIGNAQIAQWLTLLTENGLIRCYRFPGGDGETIYLFFARPSFINLCAGWIKMLLVLGFMTLLVMGQSPHKRMLRHYARTFSFKVLLFLLLLTFGSALVLALNAYNFYNTTSSRNQDLLWYEQGRVAQNLTIDFLEESGGVDTETLILLGQLLNADLSVYQDGQLLDSSNYRRIVSGTIPVLMDSRIKHQLNSGAEGIMLNPDHPIPRVFYRVNDLIYMLELGSGERIWHLEKGSYTDFLIIILFLIGLIGSWVIVFVRNHIVSPITLLNRAMSEVEKGHLQPLGQIPVEEELKQLFSGFNAMVSGVAEQQRSVSEMARMRTLVKMGRRVAHEVKNPLTPIKLSAEQIQRAMLDRQPGYEQMIGRAVSFIMEETDHLKRVSYGFLDLSKMETLEPQDFDLIELISQEIFAFQQVAPSIRFVLEARMAVPTVHLDRYKIKQVIKNLMQNAVDAIGQRPGLIEIGAEGDPAKGRPLRLWIQDDGIGMSPELVRQIFEEDFSQKDSGFGIGLFIVKRIVELHGGSIVVESQEGQGSTLRITLPWTC
jgi:signal transduction histidine kinase